MASIRLRCMNVLRKWVRMHPYHFKEDKALRKMFQNFLDCARLTGNEKLARTIESELEESVVSTRLPVTVPPLIRVNSIRNINKLEHIKPEELARQLCLIDQVLYKKLEVREFLKNNFMKKNANELTPNVKNFSQQFNKIAAVVRTKQKRRDVFLFPHFLSQVSTTILETKDESARAYLISYWIHTMSHLRVLGNYQVCSFSFPAFFCFFFFFFLFSVSLLCSLCLRLLPGCRARQSIG